MNTYPVFYRTSCFLTLFSVSGGTLSLYLLTVYFVFTASPWRSVNFGRGGDRGAAQKKYTRIPPSTARSSSLLSSWLVSADQRDITKVLKFKSLFASLNLTLGKFFSCYHYMVLLSHTDVIS